MEIKIRLDGQELMLTAEKLGDRFSVTYDGRTIEGEIVEQDRNGLTMLVNGRRIRLLAHIDGQKRQVWLEGQTFTYERLQAGEVISTSEEAASLMANIPAVVSQILVEIGDAVTEGEKLILLESMKMVIPISAPHDGVVAAINCATGEAVQPGVPLIELGTDGEGK